MRRSVLFALLVVCLLTEAAYAISTHDAVVIIPIIGRFPGASGTQWRTDVFLANPSTNVVTVTLEFYNSASGLQQSTVVLNSFNTATLPDIVLNTFGATTAAGPLEVHATGNVEARARIYNSGHPAGQFGQSAPGIGLSRLGRQAYLQGLSGLGGNRVNVGVTNPNDITATVRLFIRDKTNNIIHERTFDVPPHGNVQFNDIFFAFGLAPQEGVTVELHEFDDKIYGYASEVRNDTGDAIFVFGTSPNSGPS